jgi:hypothetical protein
VTCDDVLSALEFGDAAERENARRHARSCPACAAAIDRWLALRAALTDIPPLTDRDRAVWHAAVKGPAGRRRPSLWWAAGAAAVAATILLALLWPRPGPKPRPGPEPRGEVLTFSPERTERDLTDLGRQLDRVENELTSLANRIAAADARRQAAELKDRYQ